MTTGSPRVLALAHSRTLLVRNLFSVAANLFINTLRFDFMDALPPDYCHICLIGARDFSREEAQGAGSLHGGNRGPQRYLSAYTHDDQRTKRFLQYPKCW